MTEEYNLEYYRKALGLTKVVLQPQDELKFEQVIRTLSGLHAPAAVINWLTRPNNSFGGNTAVELIAQYDIDTVLRAVREWEEQNFFD